MSETIKQALARCRGDVFVLLDRDYGYDIPPIRLKVSKPEARRVIDQTPNYGRPTAQWEGEDLVLIPRAAELPSPTLPFKGEVE